VHQERHDGADQEHHEQNFSDACSAGGESAETEYCGNQSDDEEYDGIVKHVGTCFVSFLAQSTGDVRRLQREKRYEGAVR
jgi:hypothetical protein